MASYAQLQHRARLVNVPRAVNQAPEFEGDSATSNRFQRASAMVAVLYKRSKANGLKVTLPLTEDQWQQLASESAAVKPFEHVTYLPSLATRTLVNEIIIRDLGKASI